MNYSKRHLNIVVILHLLNTINDLVIFRWTQSWCKTIKRIKKICQLYINFSRKTHKESLLFAYFEADVTRLMTAIEVFCFFKPFFVQLNLLTIKSIEVHVSSFYGKGSSIFVRNSFECVHFKNFLDHNTLKNVVFLKDNFLSLS